MVRERPRVLASPPRWPPAAPNEIDGPLVSVELQGSAPAGSTQILMLFDLTESGRSALTL